MEGLRYWVLRLCCGAVLYGVLENLLPRQGVFPVIKTVVVLYIVLLLLSPVQEQLWEQPLLQPAQQVLLPAEETGKESIRQKTADVLQQRLEQALAAQGGGAQLLSVQLRGEGDCIESVGLRLRADDQVDKAAVQKLCDSLLGVEGAYEWEDG